MSFVGRESETHPAFGKCDAIFAAQYIRTFIHGAFSFSRARDWNAAGRWNDAKGGTRYAFPPYGLWAEAWGVRPNPVLAQAREIISLT